jgi:hypothetical protein
MISFLLAVMVLIQGAGALQPGTGIVSGSVQMIGGGSAAGVRVGAMAADDPAGADLLSVTETDGAGRFRLINIPAGRYYIVAGRLDNLTYYPGGTDKSKATDVVVEPARVISDISFSVPPESKRPPAPSFTVSAGSPESGAYGRITAERNPATKLKLLLDFEKNYPRSTRLPAVYMDLARAYAAQSNLNKAAQYAEKAVATTTKMRNEPPPGTYAATAGPWQSWVDGLDNSAKSNLAWVRQMIAWQQSQIQSAILRRR